MHRRPDHDLTMTSSTLQTPEDIEEHADASETEDPNGEEEKCCI